jgi:hypothetical protein
MVSRLFDWRRAPTCGLDISFDDWSKLQKIGEQIIALRRVLGELSSINHSRAKF